MSSQSSQPSYGFTDDELSTIPTVYRPDLFTGQTIIVSGAGSGLGKAIAFLFARLGANLAICGRDAEKLAHVVPDLESLGARVFSRSLTIRDPDQVNEFVKDVWDHFGRVDVMINNAGGQFAQMAIDFKPKGWNAVIDTNLNGSWWMMQAAAREWIERGKTGNIVNIVALIWRGLPGMAHTAAARAGVIYASKTVAVEWAPLNVRINCIAPGAIETDGWNVYSEAARAAYPRSNPMMRPGTPWDIAEAAVYLAAPSGKFITGETLTVDGGGQHWGETWTTGKPDYFKAGE